MKILLDKYQETACQSNAKRILIIAPAGSGKTRTMIARIARLIQDGISPTRLIGITFTCKAAGELHDRIKSSVGKSVKAMTIHSFCYGEILNPFATRIGYRRPVSIYDEYLSADIHADILISLGILKEDGRIYDPHRIQAALKRLEENDPDAWITADDMYQNRLKAYNATDYDGMIRLAIKVLKDSEIAREIIRASYQHVLVDEFQDTDIYQMELLKLINPENQTVCGDIDQSIYGWRSARPENVYEIARESEVINLEINYRSGWKIIEVANHLIKNNPSELRKPAIPDEDAEPGYVRIYSVADPRGMAAEIVRKSLKHHKPEAITVLCRTNALVDEMADCLDRLGIKYQKISGKGGFWKSGIVRSIIYSLMFIQNPLDIAAWSKAIDFPEKRLESSERAEIKKIGVLERKTILQATCQSEAGKAWGEKIAELVRKYAFTDIDAQEALNDVEATLGWKAFFNKLTPNLHGNTRLKFTLDRIAMELEKLKARGSGSLEDFLEWYVSRDLQEDLAQKSPMVKIATVHAYKGLENQVVILPHWTAGKFPNVRSNIQEERRLAYVAITRAIQEVHITYRETPSIFIEEIIEGENQEREANEDFIGATNDK